MSEGDLLSPSTWPTWARRAFVLTLPVSGPLWLLTYAMCFVGFVLIFSVGSVLLTAGLFIGAIVVAIARAAWGWLSGMWSAQ